MKRFHRYTVIIVFITVIFVSVISIMTFASLPKRNILQMSTLITSTKGWHSQEGTVYHWLSNQELLYFRDVKQAPAKVQVTGNTVSVAINFASGGNFYRYNITTKTQTLLSDLMERFASSGGIVDEVQVSPEYHNLLWECQNGEYCVSDIVAAHSCQNLPDKNTLWFDENHTIRFDMNSKCTQMSHLTIQNIHDLTQSKLPALTPQSQSDCGNVLTIDSKNHQLIIITLSASNIAEVGLSSIRTQSITLKHSTVKFRADSEIHKAQCSPHGDYISWVLYRLQKQPLLEALHRKVPLFPYQPQQSMELWVSKINGDDMREIGSLPSSDKIDDTPSLYNVQWLPSGNKISFVHNQTLYIVPID